MTKTLIKLFFKLTISNKAIFSVLLLAVIGFSTAGGYGGGGYGGGGYGGYSKGGKPLFIRFLRNRNYLILIFVFICAIL